MLSRTVHLTAYDSSRRGVVNGPLSESLEEGDDIVNKPLRNMTAMALLLAVGTLVSAHRAAAAAPKPALTIAFAGYDQFIERPQGPRRAQRSHEVGGQGRSQHQVADARQGLGRIGQVASLGRIGFPGRERSAHRARLSSRHRLEELLASIPVPGGETPAANAKGVYEFPMGDKTVYVKQKGKWAVFSDNEETLDSAPADPTPALADLTKKYLLSVRGSVQNVPAASRENALKSLRGIVDSRSPCNSRRLRGGAGDDGRQRQAGFRQAGKLSKELDTARHRRGHGPVEQGAVPGR